MLNVNKIFTEVIQMKFNLTITDMNEEEFTSVYHAIHTPKGDNDTVVTEPSDETINFDVDGLQWDARIHSSNHKINSDGRWQRRRGVSDVEFNNIKNELLGVTPEPVAPVVAPVVAPTPVEPHVIPMTVAPVVAPAPIAPEPQVVPMTVQPVVAPSAEFMAAIAQPVTPEINADTLYQTMFEKIKVGLANQTLKPNDIQNILTALNATLGASYPTIAAAKGNVDALQFAINELTVRGL